MENELEILMTRSLRHHKLEENVKFNELKQKLVNYYQNSFVKQYALHKDKSPAWVKTLYHSLSEMLNEVVVTNRYPQQLRLLDKVYHWYYEKTGPPPVENRNPYVDKPKRPNSVTPVQLRIDSAERTARTPHHSYIYYKPEQTTAEQRMEKKFKRLKRKQLKDILDAKITKAKMMKWSNTRARQDAENSTKIEGRGIRKELVLVTPKRQKQGRGRGRMVDLSAAQTPQPHVRSLSTKGNEKIQRLRKLHSSTIDVPKPEAPGVKLPPQTTLLSPSRYHTPQPKRDDSPSNLTEMTKDTSSYSLILSPQPESPERMNQQDEILKTKRSLARRLVPWSLQNLHHALLTPNTTIDYQDMKMPQPRLLEVPKLVTNTTGLRAKKRKRVTRR